MNSGVLTKWIHTEETRHFLVAGKLDPSPDMLSYFQIPKLEKRDLEMGI